MYKVGDREIERGATWESTQGQFLVPDWRDIVDSGRGLTYRPVSLWRLEGRYDDPMPVSAIASQSWTKNLETGRILSLVLLGRGWVGECGGSGVTQVEGLAGR